MKPGAEARRKDTRISLRENKMNERTGGCVGVCSKAAAAKGISGLVVLAEATAAESERHVGDGRGCGSLARHGWVRRVG